jgi:MoxR-like ATPase
MEHTADGGSPGVAPKSPAAPAPPTASIAVGPRLEAAVSGVVLGQGHAVRCAVAAFLAGGHILLEDVPGVGKTLFAKALAAGIGGSFGRVQGTSDLLPTDLTGVSVFNPESGSWTFEAGPLFNNVVLVDELNRSTPRTQSALLEAMAERQVTSDGVTHPLPDPFLVIATQNPQGDLGTFPLVGGQRDRFMVSLSLGVTSREVELSLVNGTGGLHALDRVVAVGAASSWASLRDEIETLYAAPEVLEYAVDLVGTVRAVLGGWTPSTRATLDLVSFAKAHAAVSGRDHVTPDDVQVGAVPVLAHRVVDATRSDLGAARALVHDAVLNRVVPPTRPAYRW